MRAARHVMWSLCIAALPASVTPRAADAVIGGRVTDTSGAPIAGALDPGNIPRPTTSSR